MKDLEFSLVANWQKQVISLEKRDMSSRQQVLRSGIHSHHISGDDFACGGPSLALAGLPTENGLNISVCSFLLESRFGSLSDFFFTKAFGVYLPPLKDTNCSVFPNRS